MLAISRILHLSNHHNMCAAASPPVITEWFLFWECFMAQLGVLLGKLKWESLQKASFILRVNLQRGSSKDQVSYIFTSWSLKLFFFLVSWNQCNTHFGSFLLFLPPSSNVLQSSWSEAFCFKYLAERCRWVYNNPQRLSWISCCCCVNLLLSEAISAAVTGTWISLSELRAAAARG